VASVHAHGIVQRIQPLRPLLVSRISKPPVALQEYGGAQIFLGIPPVCLISSDSKAPFRYSHEGQEVEQQLETLVPSRQIRGNTYAHRMHSYRPSSFFLSAGDCLNSRPSAAGVDRCMEVSFANLSPSMIRSFSPEGRVLCCDIVCKTGSDRRPSLSQHINVAADRSGSRGLYRLGFDTNRPKCSCLQSEKRSACQSNINGTDTLSSSIKDRTAVRFIPTDKGILTFMEHEPQIPSCCGSALGCGEGMFGITYSA
jgi:hypothetical protein